MRSTLAVSQGLIFLMYGSIELGTGLTSFEAELSGAEGLVHGLCHLFSIPGLEGQTQEWFSSYLADI